MTRLPLLIAVFALIGFTTIAGCTYPEASTNTVQFSGDIERIDGQFHMVGTVHIDGTNARDVTDVAVVLYDANRTVIDHVPVGSLSSYAEGPYPTRQPVNITSERLPAYVFIESPDIGTNGIPAETFCWTGDLYAECRIEREERFQSA